MRPMGGAGQPVGHLELRFPMCWRTCPFGLTFSIVSGPWTLSIDACAAKSTARREDIFFLVVKCVSRAWRGTIKGGVQDLGHRLLTADLRTSDLWTLTADY